MGEKDRSGDVSATHLGVLSPRVRQHVFAERDVILLKGRGHENALVFGLMQEEEAFFFHGATLETHTSLQTEI